MKNKKSSGHDGINSILLREIKLAVCAPLTTIFNKSLETGGSTKQFEISESCPDI